MTPPRGRITWRGWLARFGLAGGATAAFFFAAELILRLAGFGHAPDFFIPDEKPGWMRTNPAFTETFLPASFGLKPVNFHLPRAKPADEFRVFVVGESAAMGVPEPGFGLAPQLRAQLRAAWPGREIAVYNLGVTAINSHAIVSIVRAAARLQPDLFVIYMGNNEVVGPFGPSSVATQRVPPRALIRVALFFRRTRLGQAVQRLVAALRPAAGAAREWRGMEMFSRNVVAADDPKLAAVYANFAANLHEIVGNARHGGARVVLSTVAVNLRDSAPFAPAAGRENAGDIFQRARRAEAAGDRVAALRDYVAARDADTLRFRADSRINEIIRAEAAAARDGVTLVDAAKEMGADLETNAPPAGADFFFEHVHLSWNGNAALARLLAAGTIGALGPPAGPWLSPKAAATALGYTEFGHAAMAMSMDRLTARPPFTNQSTFAEARTRLREEIAQANRAVAAAGALPAMAETVAYARRQDPGNPFLLFHEATIRAQLGDFAGALALNVQLAALEPPSPELAAQKGFLLQQLGRPTEAEPLLLQSAKENPYYFQTYSLLGWIWGSAGRWDQAIDYFKTLSERMPGNLAVLHAYAGVLAGAGRWAPAEEQWRAILRLTPDDEEALEPLSRRMIQDGRAEEAIALMLAAHDYNPRSFANNARLEQIYDTKGDRARTIVFLRDLAASGPVNVQLFVDLARLLQEEGKTAEAAAALEEGERRAMAERNASTLETIRELKGRLGL